MIHLEPETLMSKHLSPPSSKPWLAAYPPGATEAIDVSTYESVLDLIEQTTGHRKNDVAFVCSGVAMTFGELSARAQALANYLGGSAGIKRGDRVAVMLPNLLEFPVCLLGLLRAGAVLVSVNPQYTVRELQHQLRDSGARVLVVCGAAMEVATGALAGTSVEQVLLVAGAVNEGATKVPVLQFDEAMARGRALHGWQAPKISREDLALLQYTGGTTGVSKGAQLTHGNIIANILQIRSMFGGTVEDGKETIVTALPLYYIFALTVNCLTFMSFGARNVLVANPRDPAQLIAAFTSEKISVVTGVNTLFSGLLTLPHLKELDFHQIKLAIGGGAAVQRAVSEAWHARSGRHILEGYGLSETSPAVTINSYENPDFTGSIGVPVPSTDVIIADESGSPLGFGVEGEICVKGPQVTRGYWQQPEASAAAFTTRGYFRTGDVGVMDERGFVRICDRKKDIVLVSGFNVYPNEIEGVIAGMAGVAECAVTGMPDAKTGEAVKAFIVRKDPNLTEAEILSHCRTQLAGYKIPKTIAFATELPRSPVGKILRRELRSVGTVSVHAQ